MTNTRGECWANEAFSGAPRPSNSTGHRNALRHIAIRVTASGIACQNEKALADGQPSQGLTHYSGNVAEYVREKLSKSYARRGSAVACPASSWGRNLGDDVSHP